MKPVSIQAIVTSLHQYKPDFLKHPLVRQWSMAISIATLLGGIFLSVYAEPKLADNIHPLPCLIILLLLAPITHILRIIEFQIHAKLQGKSLSFLEALETITLASTTDLLPLPGGILVKISRLRSLDISWKDSSTMTLLTAFIWLGAAIMCCGIVMLLTYNVFFLALGISLFGILMTITCLYSLISLYKAPLYAFIIFGLKLMTVLLLGLRLVICFTAFDSTISYTDALILATSKPASGLLFFLPTNIGVAEGMAAGIGHFILGLNAATTFLATLLNLALGLFTLTIMASIALLYTRNKDKS